ncbi:DUF2961 domain-containing protein [Dokdonella sp.]|uniref:DUF2961 domain-containing protein n=1 Tax=Dokdonella sp. TaxID=2291710 RepID=UPI003527CCAC
MAFRVSVDQDRGARLLLYASAFACLMGTPGPAFGLPWEIWQSPQRLASLDAADRVVEHSSHCPQGCRYDRSNAGPESPEANPTPLRWLYRDGAEVVVLDERGPGALTRFWMTTGNGVSTCIDPAIRIQFRFDGAAEPQLDLPLASLFDGSKMPFTPPLVADRFSSSGGFVSRVPMAYAQSLRISLSGAESGANPCTGDDFGLLWYQFITHRLPFGSEIATFNPMQDFPAWRNFLDQRGGDPWNAMLAPQAFQDTLQPGASLPLASRAGSGWLRGIRMLVPIDRRPHIHLRVVVDDEIAVDMPLADFFATPEQASVQTRSVFFGEDAVGRLYSWWPMPYRQGASLELVAGPALDSAVAVSGDLSVDTEPVPPSAGRFIASLADRCTDAGEFELLEERGAGKIVGVAARYRADGVATRGYLEGDERVVLDDAITPVWYGTGVEDFFDAGFYFDGGAFSSALSGASEVDPDGNGTTSAYRILATDPIAYSRSIRWTQEAGYSPGLPVPTCLRSVVYRYQGSRPLAVSLGRFEVGDAIQAARYHYQASPWANCATQSGQYSNEPPRNRTALDCRYSEGLSRFAFTPPQIAGPLRLRRTFDAAYGIPGTLASASAAEVRVNGVRAGWFPPAAANRARRWQEQEVLLADLPGASQLEFEIVPESGSHAAGFGESAWELLGGWVDPVFSDTFDGSGVR